MNVVLFPREHTRTRIIDILGLAGQDPVIQLETPEYKIYRHTYENVEFYTSSFGDTETQEQFGNKLTSLCSRDEPWIPIICVSSNIFRDFLNLGIQRRIHLGTGQSIARKLGLELDASVIEALNEILRQSLYLIRLSDRPEVGGNIASLLRFLGVEIRIQNGPPDGDFLAAQDASMNGNNNNAPVKRVKIEKTWEDVLHETPDKIESELDPVCVICCEFRASICFVNCTHQVCCDKCVREILSRVDQKKICPVCQQDIGPKIVRPILSGSSNAK